MLMLCLQVPFYRPNLHFSVVKRPSRAYEALVEYIWCDRPYAGASGLGSGRQLISRLADPMTVRTPDPVLDATNAGESPQFLISGLVY